MDATRPVISSPGTGRWERSAQVNRNNTQEDGIHSHCGSDCSGASQLKRKVISDRKDIIRVRGPRTGEAHIDSSTATIVVGKRLDTLKLDGIATLKAE